MLVVSFAKLLYCVGGEGVGVAMGGKFVSKAVDENGDGLDV